MNPAPAILATDLSKSYGGRQAPVQALRGISLAVGRGETVAVLGKSGSGKSTLLSLLGGLDRPSGGSVRVAGLELTRLSGRELADFRLHTVGMIHQAFNLLPARTALQNVELPMVLAGRALGERRRAAVLSLAAVGLGHRLHHRPAELSGGEQQRVAIARSLANSPAVLLADEPTGNLDSATAEEVLTLLIDHSRRQGVTLIVVSHDEELACRHAGRVVRMRDGELVA